MPYIRLATNQPISPEKQLLLKEEIGKIIAIIGKKEARLMLEFCPNSSMFFSGSGAPCAMLAVAQYGKGEPAAFNEMTAAVTKLLEQQLAIPAERLFVNYSEYSHWGLNGSNF